MTRTAPHSGSDTSRAAAKALQPSRCEAMRQAILAYVEREGGASDRQLFTMLKALWPDSDDDTFRARRWELSDRKPALLFDNGRRAPHGKRGRLCIVWEREQRLACPVDSNGQLGMPLEAL